jgi:hypothetical protein
MRLGIVRAIEKREVSFIRRTALRLCEALNGTRRMQVLSKLAGARLTPNLTRKEGTKGM